MKNKLRLLFLSPILFSLVGCNNSPQASETPKESVDVVIISGQSNGVGCTHSDQIPDSMGNDKYNEYLAGYENIKIAYNCWAKEYPPQSVFPFYLQNGSLKNKFEKVKLGQGNGTGTFGPEIGIAEETHEKYGNKLFLVKFACGGSNLKDDWLAKNSPMYPKLIEYVQTEMAKLEEMGYKPTIKAFCWMQGEGDAWADYYDSYLNNLRTFVTNVRTDLRSYSGDKEFAFIDAGINNNPARWQYWEEVNNAKIAFAAESENNIYIDTIGAGMHTNLEPVGNVDGDHYDSDSEVLLGHLFAQAFEPFLEKSSN